MRNLILLATLLGTACATPYQRRGIRGGYDDTQLDQNVFRVSFESNMYVGAPTTSDYVLLRSAEVALEHGFAFFVVASGESAAAVVGGKNFTGTAPSAVSTILCFSERPEGETRLVYDAATVRKVLRTKYALDGPAPGAVVKDRSKPIDPYATE